MKYNIKSVAYVLPILIFAPVYNIPRFFEFTSNPEDPNKNSTMFCGGENETVTIEDQLLIELVIKLNESIWNSLKILCIQNNPVDFLVLTETRKDNLYILVNILFLNTYSKSSTYVWLDSNPNIILCTMWLWQPYLVEHCPQ